MADETVRLAEYAQGLRYETLPPEVVQRAKDCIADTVAVIVQGGTLPWSQIVIRYAQRIGAGGDSRILGVAGSKVHAPAAALVAAFGASGEAGVLAASLAADGLTGPRSVIGGEAGFLKVFCTEYDAAELSGGLRPWLTYAPTARKGLLRAALRQSACG